MVNYSMKRYQILEKENEENKILIWPDVPYWLYVNNDTQKVIEVISKHSNFNEMVKAVNLLFPEKICGDELQSLFAELCEAKVIEDSMEVAEIKDSNTHYIIRTVTLNITDKCNLFCKHCYIGASSRKTQFMGLQDAKKVIDKIWPYMNPSCSFIVSGGEALLNPDCIDILKYITSKGKGKINLVTNGTTITPELADKLSKIKGLSVQVSLDGATKEVHEAIRGKGSYKNTIRGLQLLADRNQRIILSPMVTEGLLEELEEYFEIAKRVKAVAVFLQPVNNVGRARKNGMRRVRDVLVLNRLVEIYEKNPEILKFVPGSLEAKYISSICLLSKCNNCGVGSTTLAIQPNGDIYPCPNNITDEMKLGNILCDNFDKIWNDSATLKELRDIDVDKNLAQECRDCPVKHFCGGGCRGVTYQNTGDIHGKTPICAYEKEQRIEMIWLAAKKPYIFAHEVVHSLEAVNNDIVETAETVSFLEKNRGAVID
nr:radical SAM protein [uncultured Blautia sp.]